MVDAEYVIFDSESDESRNLTFPTPQLRCPFKLAKSAVDC